MTVNAKLRSAPLDPGLAAFLDQAAAQDNPPMESLPPEVGRQILRDLAASLGLPPPAVASVEDTAIQGPGGKLPLRIYRPKASGQLPTLLFVHGGGFVIGDLETHDAVCRTLCHDVEAVVLAVDYRLAPEHLFPAALDDVVFALEWLAANARHLGVDPSRIALAGDSAGAQLAATACLRTTGVIAPRALGMIYPFAEHHSEPSPSKIENAEGKFLTNRVSEHFLDTYLGEPDKLARHPDFALLHAPSLSTLPQTWVATVGHDILRDEGHALALRLEREGVPTEHCHYPAAIHACIQFTAVSNQGVAIMADLAAWMRHTLK